MELKNYWRAVKKRLWLILVCVAISTAITGYYTYSTYRPFYQASAKLIVNNTFSNEAGVEQMDTGAIQSNVRLIETYKEIIKSTAIMNKVVEQYPEVAALPDELIRLVNVYSINNTQIMVISVTGADYERSAQIVNAVSTVFRAELPQLMKINNLTLLTEAPMISDPQPFNLPATSNMVLSFIISLLFSVGIIFLLEYMDDTIKTEDDIYKVFEAPILASVMMIEKKDMQARSRAQKKIKAGEAQYVAANR